MQRELAILAAVAGVEQRQDELDDIGDVAGVVLNENVSGSPMSLSAGELLSRCSRRPGPAVAPLSLCESVVRPVLVASENVFEPGVKVRRLFVAPIFTASSGDMTKSLPLILSVAPLEDGGPIGQDDRRFLKGDADVAGARPQLTGLLLLVDLVTLRVSEVVPPLTVMVPSPSSELTPSQQNIGTTFVVPTLVKSKNEVLTAPRTT